MARENNETELILAPQEVQDVKKLIPIDCYKYVKLNSEAKQLAETYISDKVLGKGIDLIA